MIVPAGKLALVPANSPKSNFAVVEPVLIVTAEDQGTEVAGTAMNFGSIFGQCKQNLQSFLPLLIFLIQRDLIFDKFVSFTMDTSLATDHEQPGRMTCSAQFGVKRGDTAVSPTTTNSTSRLTITNKQKLYRSCVFGGVSLPTPRHMLWNFVNTDRQVAAKATEA